MRGPFGVLAWLVLVAPACFGPRDILARGQAYYEDNEYERALAVWRELERHEPVLTAAERARYAYLRGMTDYRLGFRDDARHWLAMAKITEQRHPGSLTQTWMARLDGALGDLDREIFGIRADGKDSVQSIEAAPDDVLLRVQPVEAPPEQRPPEEVAPGGGPPSPALTAPNARD